MKKYYILCSVALAVLMTSLAFAEGVTIQSRVQSRVSAVQLAATCLSDLGVTLSKEDNTTIGQIWPMKRDLFCCKVAASEQQGCLQSNLEDIEMLYKECKLLQGGSSGLLQATNNIDNCRNVIMQTQSKTYAYYIQCILGHLGQCHQAMLP